MTSVLFSFCHETQSRVQPARTSESPQFSATDTEHHSEASCRNECKQFTGRVCINIISALQLSFNWTCLPLLISDAFQTLTRPCVGYSECNMSYSIQICQHACGYTTGCSLRHLVDEAQALVSKAETSCVKTCHINACKFQWTKRAEVRPVSKLCAHDVWPAKCRASM
jgi:hypothetical protein